MLLKIYSDARMKFTKIKKNYFLIIINNILKVKQSFSLKVISKRRCMQIIFIREFRILLIYHFKDIMTFHLKWSEIYWYIICMYFHDVCAWYPEGVNIPIWYISWEIPQRIKCLQQSTNTLRLGYWHFSGHYVRISRMYVHFIYVHVMYW